VDLIPLEEFNSVGVELAVTKNQLEYLKSVRKNTVTFIDAQAGCGKTFLGVAEAVRSLVSHARADKKIKQIIFIRPAITAGEKIGFLPGTREEKTEHFMEPFVTSVSELFGRQFLNKMIKEGLITFETLSFMRGRTWSNAFVVIDEAQNCTRDQMKLLLTRIGKYTKVVVAGDADQPDLRETSGFTWAINKFSRCDPEVKGVAIRRLYDEDNMRHPIVKNIVRVLEDRWPASNENEIKWREINEKYDDGDRY
jgi:phosphate starvation-inducible PhoH-like protein